MTFLKIVQEKLREKKRLLRSEAYDLAYQFGHDFDTLRRNLEPDKTPFSKPCKIGNRIKWWDYVGEDVPENLNEKLRNLIRNTKVSYENKEKLAELGNALVESDYKKEEVIKKYE